MRRERIECLLLSCSSEPPASPNPPISPSVAPTPAPASPSSQPQSSQAAITITCAEKGVLKLAQVEGPRRSSGPGVSAGSRLQWYVDRHSHYQGQGWGWRHEGRSQPPAASSPPQHPSLPTPKPSTESSPPAKAMKVETMGARPGADSQGYRNMTKGRGDQAPQDGQDAETLRHMDVACSREMGPPDCLVLQAFPTFQDHPSPLTCYCELDPCWARGLSGMKTWAPGLQAKKFVLRATKRTQAQGAGEEGQGRQGSSQGVKSGFPGSR